MEIAVIGPIGQRATIIAVPNPSRTLGSEDASELIYVLGGLIVDKISEGQFRDFQGTLWTAET